MCQRVLGNGVLKRLQKCAYKYEEQTVNQQGTGGEKQSEQITWESNGNVEHEGSSVIDNMSSAGVRGEL